MRMMPELKLGPHVHPVPTAQDVRRAAWAGLVGTMLEQYDFVIYGTASALIFSRLFFPNISPAAGTMASFGAYAVGFAARPLGGLFFSRYGDRPRPQVGARRDAAVHGRLDARDRSAADVRSGGAAGAGAAGPLSILPGVRCGRRTGGRCDAAHRDRAGWDSAAATRR